MCHAATPAKAAEEAYAMLPELPGLPKQHVPCCQTCQGCRSGMCHAATAANAAHALLPQLLKQYALRCCSQFRKGLKVYCPNFNREEPEMELLTNNSSRELPILPFSMPFGVGTFLAGLWVIFENGLLLAVTYKSAHLRSRCNILIAVLAFFDLLSAANFLFEAVLFLTGHFWVEQTYCARLYTLMYFSLNTGTAMIFAIGIDRYLAIAYPVWYFNSITNKRRYLAILSSPCVLFGLANCLNVWLFQRQTAKQIVCLLPLAVTNYSAAFMHYSNQVLCAGVVLVYGNAARLLKRQINDDNANNDALLQPRQRLQSNYQKIRLFWSLILVVLVYLGSVGLIVLGLTVLRNYPENHPVRLQATMYLGWLMLVNIGSNCPIYALRCQDYRNAMAALFTL